MTDRKTASEITDAELDQLYRDRDTARRMLDPDDLRLVDEMTATVEQHMGRAKRAEAELARLHTGEEDGYDERVESTPGQWLRRFNRATAEKRLNAISGLREAAARGDRCFLMDHEKRIQQATRAEAAIARVRELRDSWLLMTLEPGQVRRLLDGITHALDGEQPTPATTGSCSTAGPGTEPNNSEQPA